MSASPCILCTYMCMRSGHGALENGEGNFSGNDVWCLAGLVLICMSRVHVKPMPFSARQGPCLDYLKDRISLQDAVSETHSMRHRRRTVPDYSATRDSRSQFSIPTITFDLVSLIRILT